MSPENSHESYVDRFSFLTPESRRVVLTIAYLFDEVTELARSDIRVLDKKDEIVANFHKSIKTYCLEFYGKEKLWEQVPEAQKLIGGTLEDRIDITDEQFEEISNQVLRVVANLEVLRTRK